MKQISHGGKKRDDRPMVQKQLLEVVLLGVDELGVRGFGDMGFSKQPDFGLSEPRAVTSSQRIKNIKNRCYDIFHVFLKIFFSWIRVQEKRKCRNLLLKWNKSWSFFSMLMYWWYHRWDLWCLVLWIANERHWAEIICELVTESDEVKKMPMMKCRDRARISCHVRCDEWMSRLFLQIQQKKVGLHAVGGQ